MCALCFVVVTSQAAKLSALSQSRVRTQKEFPTRLHAKTETDCEDDPAKLCSWDMGKLGQAKPRPRTQCCETPTADCGTRPQWSAKCSNAAQCEGYVRLQPHAAADEARKHRLHSHRGTTSLTGHCAAGLDHGAHVGLALERPHGCTHAVAGLEELHDAVAADVARAAGDQHQLLGHDDTDH